MRAKFATLINHFHLTLPEIGKLTHRQIDDLYFHHRDEHGNIAVPGVQTVKTGQKTGQKTVEYEEGTLEYELAAIDAAAKTFKWKAEEVDRLKQKLHERFKK